MDIKSLLKRAKIIVPIFLLLVSAVTPALAESVEPTQNTINFKLLAENGRIGGNRFIVKYRNTQTPGFGSSILSQYKLDSFTPLFTAANKLNLNLNVHDFAKWHLVKFKAGQNIQQAYEQLKNDSNVESITPDWIVSTKAAPNDLDEQLWGLENTGQLAQKWRYIEDSNNPGRLIADKYFEAGTPGSDINATAAWDLNTDSSDVIVAVIDSGIDYNHEDLRNNMWTNTGEIADNGIDDDGNGFIDDIYGYNFVSGNGNPMDDFYHGTHCAGTIAAEGNNGIGITGVSWNAKLMAVKVLDQSGMGYISDIAAGIIYATNMGAKVSNNSYGAIFEQELFGRAVYGPVADAFKAANDAGMVAVVSAGNSNADLDDITDTDEELTAVFPVSVEAQNIISVAATDADDALAPFSNYGFTDVDIAAPGVGIYSTIPNNGYKLASGTSMAGPHVAGAAALLLAQNPDLKPYEVRAILMQTGDSVDSLQDITVSGKRLNVYAALTHFSDEVLCDNFTATLAEHESAGRAYSLTKTTSQTCWGTFCWGGTTTTTYYAEGSAEELGTISTTVATLTETSSGNFSTAGACAGGNDLPPVITLNGEMNDYIILGTQYQKPGATATDSEDGDISSNITIAGSVNVNIVGNYPLTYEVTDSAGNNAVKVTRFVNVRETDGTPQVYISPVDEKIAGTELVFHEKGTSWNEPGYFAWDRIDGDLTSQATVDSFDTNIEGFHVITYKATDSKGNAGIAQRTVAVLDANKPFIMSTDNPYDVSTFSSDDLVEYSRAVEEINEYGNCPKFSMFSMPVDLEDKTSLSVTSSGEVNLCEAGIYDINLNVTDNDGYTDTQIVRVTVSDGSSSCVTAQNTDHVTTGRAELKYNVLVYANGSQNYLGMSSDTSSLEETSDGTWTKVTTCP